MPILHFKGKSVIQNHHHTVKFHELEAVKSKGLSKEPSLDDNLIIHGDNLIALKALLPTYAGKVKCIYIDPPYNTGNEHWVYNDNVNSPMIKEWLGKEVGRDDLSRHDKWCCMMYPRLTLLRELLRDDGIIFISIDDNEVEHLRMMMNEIFGNENFIATVIWQKIYAPKNSARHFSEDHDYIVVYAKNSDIWKPNLLPRSEESNAQYSNPDNDPRGLWRPNNLAARNYYSKGTYAITCPGGRKIEGPPKGSYWRVSEEKLWELDKEGRIWWGDDKNNVPAPKVYMSEVMQGRVPETLWTYQEVGHTQDAKRELLAILNFENSDDVFITPKPSTLVEHALRIGSDKDSIVLDSFAGSGTTAHAALALNAEDGGNRRFILVECEDYADKLTAERVRRVSKGVKGAKDEKLKKGLGGTFSFYELGKPIDIDKMLEGDDLPSYANLAHYAFFTATGETFNPKKMKEKEYYIGSSSTYEVFMLYAPDAAKLRELALNLDFAQQIEKKFPGKAKLVFAPACFLEEFDLRDRNIRFAQLPFEIYRLAE